MESIENQGSSFKFKVNNQIDEIEGINVAKTIYFGKKKIKFNSINA